MDDVWRGHALDAWDALTRSAFRPKRRGIKVLDGPGGAAAPLWPFTHVLWAAAEVLGIGGDPPIDQLIRTLEHFRRGGGFAATPRGRRYFDDNAWLGLASLRLRDVTGDEEHGVRASALAAFVPTGEHPDGGVRWAERSESRNTCSTASAAWLVMEVDRRLGAGAGADRAFAGRCMAWLNDVLLRRDGLYGDRLEDGLVVRAALSYNQGAAIAASDRLGHDTSRTVGAAVELFRGDRLWREPPAFAVILFRALLEDPLARPDAITTLDDHLARLLRAGHGHGPGLVGAPGLGSYDGHPTIDQAAVTQLLALRAAA
ncbi:MAG: hypothetical protein ACXWW5_00960 [Actinomycetota bacterium]